MAKNAFDAKLDSIAGNIQAEQSLNRISQGLATPGVSYPEARKPSPGLMGGIADAASDIESSFEVGSRDLGNAAVSLGVLYGQIDPDEAADYISTNQQISHGVSGSRLEETQRQIDTILNSDGFWNKAGNIITNPRGATNLIVQNLPNALPSMAAAGAGASGGAAAGALTGPAAPVAVPVLAGTGAVLGGFLGGAPTEIGAWVDQALQERGVDISSKEARAAAYRNRALMDDVRGEAERKGLTTAAVDSVWNLVSGSRLFKSAGKSLPARITAGAKDVGVQMAGESASEGAGQVAAYKGDLDKVNMDDVYLEGLLSGPQAVVETGAGLAVRNQIREGAKVSPGLAAPPPGAPVIENGAVSSDPAPVQPPLSRDDLATAMQSPEAQLPIPPESSTQAAPSPSPIVTPAAPAPTAAPSTQGFSLGDKIEHVNRFGEVVEGTVQGVQTTDAGTTVTVQGPDGNLVTIFQDEGPINVVGKAPARSDLQSALDSEAPGIMVEQPAPAPVEQATAPVAPVQEAPIVPETPEKPVDELTNLEKRLKNVQAQAKMSGWNRSLTKARDDLQTQIAAINKTREIDEAAATVNTSPTEGQKEAGNYKKGHVSINGMNISIENPKGSKRSGKSPDGTAWEVDMPAHYGYIKRTTGADEEQMDVYVGDNPNAPEVFVIDQVDADNRDFDEHKAMIGFDSIQQAMDAYNSAFSDGRAENRVGDVTIMTVDEFKGWLKGDETKKPLLYKKPETEQGKAPAGAQGETPAPTESTDQAGAGTTTSAEKTSSSGRPMSADEQIVEQFWADSMKRNDVDTIAANIMEAFYVSEMTEQRGDKVITKTLRDGAEQMAKVYANIIRRNGKPTPMLKKNAQNILKEIHKAHDWLDEHGAKASSASEPPSEPIKVAKKTSAKPPKTGLDLTARPDLGPSFDDPKGQTQQIAVLRATQEGRHTTKDAVTGSWKWLLRNEYGAEGKGGKISLTDKGLKLLSDLEGEVGKNNLPNNNPQDSLLKNAPENDGIIRTESSGQENDVKSTASPSSGGLSETFRWLDEAISTKSAAGLREIIGNLDNKNSRARFEEKTGIKLPKTKSGTLKVIDEFVGLSEADRASIDQQDKERRENDALDREAKYYGNVLSKANVKTDSGETINAKDWVDKLIADGFNQIVKVMNNGKTEYMMVKPSGAGYNLSRFRGIGTDVRKYVVAVTKKQPIDRAAFKIEEVGQPTEQSDEEKKAETRPEEREPFSHEGIEIYPTSVNGTDYWAVQQRGNAGTNKFMGDTLHKTREEAISQAELDAKRYADDDRRQERLRQETDAAERKKEENKGKSISERKADSVLDKPHNYGGKNAVGMGKTKREFVRAAIEKGWKFEERQVADGAARKRDEAAVKRAKDSGYILGLSNENIPVVREALEARDRLKANDYKKTEYIVRVPLDDSFYDITKTEFDFSKTIKKPSEKKDATKNPKEASGDKIDDFGEKLQGAKKDLWQEYQRSMTDALPDDVQQITLSKYFPEPNYEALLASGVNPYTLAWIKAARDSIPAKPRQSYKVRDWIKALEYVRANATALLEGKEIPDMKLPYSLRDLPDTARLYDELGYPAFTKAKGWSISSSDGAYENGKPIGRRVWFLAEGNRYGDRYDTREEALEALKTKLSNAKPQEKKTKLDIYRVVKTGDIVIGKKVAAGKYIDLKTGLKSAKEARQYLVDNYDDLIATLEKKKDVDPERRSVNDPRIGKDYRKGEDISPDTFAKTFGFRGVQFGNYVEQKRRAADLNNAYDALLDMANLLDIPARAVSLDGTLGLAFGARGSGGKGAPSAHYEPNNIVINLTKASGPGTLGHEWFHALDHNFGMRREGSKYLTDEPRQREVNRDGTPAEKKIRQEVVDAFAGVMKAISNTDLRKRSKVRDEKRSKDYWSTPIEMAARSFEAYLVYRGKINGETNDYLANIVGQPTFDSIEDEQNSDYPYPTDKEMEEKVAPAFDKLFETLETKETDKGVALFRRPDAKRSPQQRQQIQDKINAHLKKVGFPEANVVVYDPDVDLPDLKGIDPDVQGAHYRGIVYISMGADDIIGTINHEVLHALKSAGAFTKAEWAMLTARAKEWRKKYNVDGRYEDLGLTDAQLDEEGIAHAIQDQRIKGLIERIRNRIIRFFREIRNVLTGKPFSFKTAEDVFDAVLSGEISGRVNSFQKRSENPRPMFQKELGDYEETDRFSIDGVDVYVYEYDKALELSRIEVDEDKRNTGLGSKAMQKIIDYADSVQKPIILTATSELGARKKRLIEFYERFGFVDNKGKNKDYSLPTGNMVRYPEKKEQESLRNTDTEAFKKWFGDSKVVDAEGKPLVVYHGTSSDFEQFRVSGTGEFGPGIYLTDSPDEASSYTPTNERGANAGRNVIPLYASIQNPFVVKEKASEFWEKFGGASDQEAVQKAISEGYDGIIFERDEAAWVDGKGIVKSGNRIKHLVAFRPTQIKSVFNRGTFDPDDPRIMFSLPKNRKKAVEAAAAALKENKGPVDLSSVEGIGRGFRDNLGKVASYILHPHQVASLYQSFTPVYTTAINMMKARDRMVHDLTDKIDLYNKLDKESKQRVDAVLELGRLDGKTYKPVDGKITVKNDDYDTAHHSKPGETISLTDAETEAYTGVRGAMDEALETYKRVVLQEYGFLERGIKTTADLTKALAKENDETIKKLMQDALRILTDIDAAKRRGYIPFKRWGQVGVTVRKKSEEDGVQGDLVWFERVEVPTNKLLRKNQIGENKVVKESLATLREKYPADDYDIEVFEVKDFTDLQAKIDLKELDVLAASSDMKDSDYAALRAMVSDAMKRRGFRQHFFQAKDVPGYDADFERAINDYIVSISGHLARRQFNQKLDDAVKSIEKSGQSTVFDYARKYVNYINEPTEEFAAIRQTAFLWYLAGNIASGLTNSAQPFMVTAPWLNGMFSHAEIAKTMSGAYKDAAKMATTKKGLDAFDLSKAPDDVREALIEADEDGLFIPLSTNEAMAISRTNKAYLRGFDRGVREVMDVVGATFSVPERINRLVTYTTAYRFAKNPENQSRIKSFINRDQLGRQQLYGKTGEDFARAFAEYAVYSTQYRMGKLNRPQLSRGMGTLPFQFMSYVLQSMELMYRLSKVHGEKKGQAIAMMMLAVVAMSGLKGIPFEDDLQKMLEAAYKSLTGVDVDVDTEARKLLTEYVGPTMTDIIMNGVPYGLLNVDMSGRLGYGNILPQDQSDMLGVWYDMLIQRPKKALESIMRGDPLQAAADVSPAIIRNPLQAFAWSESGVRSGKTGKVVIEPESLSKSDIILKGLGFTSADVARERARIYAEQRASHAVDQLRNDYYSELARSYALRRRLKQEGDSDGAARMETKIKDIMDEIRDHNADAPLHKRVIINERTLMQRVKQEALGAAAVKVRKQARREAEELNKAYAK